ncbi:MAG: FGGY-family carbohydrate kinase [Beutenbergiaceae bacterium]
MALVFAIDIGTSSSKAVVVDEHGTVLRSATRSHEVSRPAFGHVEMDAAIWWSEFTELATELTTDLPEPVAAIGVSGMGPCLLVATEDGEPLRPAILYGVDTRSTEQIALWNAKLGEDQILQRTGSALSSQAVGPKIAWVRQHEPEIWAQTRRMFMPASWLAFTLTGEYVLDHHSASQCTPMYDPHDLSWLADWAPQIAPGLELPALRWAGEQAGVTQSALAGIPAGTPVITGTIDAWSEATSVGAIEVGDLMLMYGTTMFLVATVAEPIRTPSMWGTVGTFPGTRNLAGGLATSGAITSWLRDLTSSDYPTLLADAESSGPGANGLLMLPYFAGERTPIMDPQARGLIAGLTLDHGQGDLYRAALEGTAFAVRHNIETMQQAGADIRRLVAVGGGTTGGLWTQVISDVIGRPQVLPQTTIGASYGAAFLAMAMIADADINTWNPAQTTVTPNSALADFYHERYQQYRSLYPATRDVVHTLAQPSTT